MERTNIDDLDLSGYELSEEHLRLASGGRRSDLTLDVTGGWIYIDGKVDW